MSTAPSTTASSTTAASTTAPSITGGSPSVPPPAFPELSLNVRPLEDPVLTQLGHDPRSDYVERFWLSILGPSAVLFLRRLATHLDREPDGFELDLVECAQELGLGAKGGKHSPMWRTLDRICRFGLATRSGPNVALHRNLPPLTMRQVDRLPAHLQRAHTERSRS